MLHALTATAPDAAAAVTVSGPKRMSQAEIRAHNATVPRDHPYYIRYVRSEAPGSLVKRTAGCRTNHLHPCLIRTIQLALVRAAHHVAGTVHPCGFLTHGLDCN